MILRMKTDLQTQTACMHCGTYFLGSALFCCVGCEFVFNLVQKEGLGRYYQLRDINPPVCPVPVNRSSHNYESYDDPAFIERVSSDGLRLKFFLEGLNCTACLWLLEKLPTFCSDAQSARVNMSTSTIEICRVPTGSFSAIAQTLNRFGYQPHPLRETEASDQLQKKGAPKRINPTWGRRRCNWKYYAVGSFPLCRRLG